MPAQRVTRARAVNRRVLRVQLLEQVPIHETIVVVRQQVENVVGEELALRVIRR